MDKYISLEEATYLWGVSSAQVEEWITNEKFKIVNSPYNTLRLKTSDFKSIAYSEEVRKASWKAFESVVKRREKDEEIGNNQKFSDLISEITKKYRSDIQTLKIIHRKYAYHFDFINDETAITAAYIIYSKVISMLEMTCLCLENHLWDGRILLRPIEEAINLARYFILIEDTDTRKKDLMAWYRENIIPKSKTIIDTLAQYLEPNPAKELHCAIKDSLKFLHYIKSKPIHNDYRGIMEVYQAKIEKGKLSPIYFEYGTCSDKRQMLKFTEAFYESCIVPAYQGFYFCFVRNLPIEELDVNIINSYAYVSENNE